MILVLFQVVILLIASVCFGLAPEWLVLALEDAWEQLKQIFSGAACQERSSANSEPTSVLAQGIGRLPAITRGELVRMLRLEDLASLATAERSFQASLWDSANVWHILAANRRFSSVISASDGWDARRLFRHALYRLDGSTLRKLPNTKHQDFLKEAARMVFGLLPEDFDDESSDGGVDDSLFSRMEMVLGDVDPENVAANKTAQSLLKVVRDAIMIIGEIRVEKLEHAYNSAQELHKMMMSAMKSHLHCQIQNMEDRFWQDAPSSLKPLRVCSSTVNGPGPLERKRLRKEASMSEVSPMSSASTQSPPMTPQASGRFRSFSGTSGSF